MYECHTVLLTPSQEGGHPKKTFWIEISIIESDFLGDLLYKQSVNILKLDQEKFTMIYEEYLKMKND